MAQTDDAQEEKEEVCATNSSYLLQPTGEIV